MLLHWAITIAFFMLLMSGFLLLYPELRLELIGGYSLTLINVHKYVAIAYVPLVLVYLWNLYMVYTTLGLWQKIHIAAVSIFGALLVISGFGVWFYRDLPYRVVADSSSVHDIMTFLVIPVLLIHLTQIRKVQGFVQKRLKNLT